jgi:uncharacterized membrane protein YfcA
MPYVEIALAALIAGTLDTVAGFGGGLLLIPILVLVVGSVDAVLLSAIIPLGWNAIRLAMLKEWIDWRRGGLVAIGTIPGSIIAAQFIGVVDPHLVRIGIGVLLLLFGGYHVVRLYVELPGIRPLGSAMLVAVGVVSGAIGGLFGAGNGPLQTLALSHTLDGARYVAATNGVLGATSALSRLIGYGISGALHQMLWIPGLIGLVAAAVGASIGIRLSQRTKDSTLELVMGIAIVLAGIKMMF